MGRKSREAKARHDARDRPRLDLNLTEVMAIVERSKEGPLADDDHAKLKTAVETLTFVADELRDKRATLERLRYWLFGRKSEKTSQVLGKKPGSKGGPKPEGPPPGDPGRDESKPKPKPKRPGHGRNGAAAFTGAERVNVPHPTLKGGDPCPASCQGHVYEEAEPAKLVRITGVAPVSATVYTKDRLRCNLCGEVFTAPSPEGVGEEKYDEKATAMIGLLRYGAGLPFNRIEKLQKGMGIPLPAGTQWEIVRDGAAVAEPVLEELIYQAAQGSVMHNDDTSATVLELTQQREEAAAAGTGDERTGTFTSGIVAKCGDHQIGIFRTGGQHAGENLSDILEKRSPELPPPIQMSDGLAANTTGRSGPLKTIPANCTVHSRRKYVEVLDDFPEECRHALEAFRQLFINDAFTKKQKLSAEERLRYHQAESGPLMDDLQKWAQGLLDEHKVEPNSGLGGAINYMLKRWEKLTLFLREPGAPLENNPAERLLKFSIRHRRNSLFYRTHKGAHVGDLFMSLIYTAEINGAEPFDYLVALLQHPEDIAKAPADWLPWNYQDTLARLSQASQPPPG